MRLMLLRHGQTPNNVIGALDTAVPGASLTALGRAQAAAVPAQLVDIETIAVSTLLRTQETAAPLATALKLAPRVFDGLKEIQAGDLELQSDHHSQGEYNTTAFEWAKGDLDLRMPGGESGHEFLARFDDAIAQVVASVRGTALVVSHGAAIRTWVASRCDNTSGEFAGDHLLNNTGLVTLRPRHFGGGQRRWHLLNWHTAPIGGAQLADTRAVDPTGMEEESSAHTRE